jgi:hypothetical protein
LISKIFNFIETTLENIRTNKIDKINNDAEYIEEMNKIQSKRNKMSIETIKESTKLSNIIIEKRKV